MLGLELVQLIAQTLHDKKATNLLALDVTGLSSMTDYFVIAEGNVNRHVVALAKAVEDELVKRRWPVHSIEGVDEGEWVVIDCWEVVVHLFVPAMRQKYKIERIWEQAQLVNLNIDWDVHEPEPVAQGLRARPRT